MLLPSIVIGYVGGKPEALFVGADADKAKESYRANAENPKFDAIQLFVRPEYTRRSTPAKHVEQAKRRTAEASAKAKADAEAKAKEQSEASDQPKRKATK